ncbi:hypothetical protein [uncultured Amnibacterium sp.]|uniref:hypothetical protein n=1 Tax=uncultured Amnibacterium sp. TaxID=1631851 RepID=UPI0035CAAEB2
MGVTATDVRLGGWTVGAVVGRRPAGVARDAVHPGSGARAVLVVVDARFTDRMPPDAEQVARAAVIGSPAVLPMLDAGLLDDGTRWYATPAAPADVLDPASGCSPRRAATIAAGVATALAAVHTAGLVHGLIGPHAVVPAGGRHAGGAIGTTLLLDTGVAALLGDRAAQLAAASGVALPADRGQEADVYSLGALLLRLLTAAAPAGPALAALPPEMRGLLSAMLDEDPARRPTAGAVALRLAGLREGLLATAPIDLHRADRQPVTAERPAAAVPPAPVSRSVAAPVRPERATPAVPPPSLAPRPATGALRTPVTAASPTIAPRPMLEAAPSLWTGSLPVHRVDRSARRGRTLLLVAGGIGLAGLIVGVVAHLPTDRDAGVGAVAAAAQDGVLGVRPAAPDDLVTATATAGTARHRADAATSSVTAAAAPAFARPTTPVPSPLAASATSSTPSRNTTAPTTRSEQAPPSSAPPSSMPSRPAPASPAPSSATQSSSTPSSAPQSSSMPSSSAPSGSTPGSSTPSATASDSASSTPTASVAPAPSASSTPSAAAPTPSESATPDAGATADAGGGAPAAD